MVVNATLAAMVKHARNPGVNIYHVASSIANPVSLRNIAKIVFEHFKYNPYIDKKGEPIRLVKELTYIPAEEDFYGALAMDLKSPGVS
jgi:fatty acyl-CoA reductase